MIPTKFMTGLKDRLGEEKGLSEVSTNSYIRALYAMNVKKPFHSLNFLKKPNVIETNIEGYAPSTKTTFYTIATSVLELVKDEPGYKRPYTTYYKKMMEGRNEQKEAYAKNELTEREKSVWMTWDQVKAVHADLKKEVDAFISNAVLSKSEQDKLLSYLVLSLYVLIPPRRNRDYMDLVIVNHVKEDMPKDKNYYDLTSKKLHGLELIAHRIAGTRLSLRLKKIPTILSRLNCFTLGTIRLHSTIKQSPMTSRLMLENIRLNMWPLARGQALR
jgi:hypothetical protein